MPTIVKTYQGIVTEIIGQAVIRGKDGKQRELKLGELVRRGDKILTTDDGIVVLTLPDAESPASVEAERPPQATVAVEAGKDTAAASQTDQVTQSPLPELPGASAPASAGAEGPVTASAPASGGISPTVLGLLAVPAALLLAGGSHGGSSDSGSASTPASGASAAAGTGSDSGTDSAHQPGAGTGSTGSTTPPTPPVAASTTIQAAEDGAPVSLGLSAPAGLSANAALTVTKVPDLGSVHRADGTLVSVGDHLTAAQLAGLTYAPPADYDGHSPAGVFGYDLVDAGGIASGTTTISLTASNHAPVAIGETLAGPEDQPITGQLLTNDSDPEGSSLAVTGFSVGGHAYSPGATATLPGVGSVAIDALGAYVFTPAPDWSGTVPAVSYTVSDGTASTTAVLNLQVTPVNDPPVANDDLASTPINQPITVAVLASDQDPDHDTLTVTAAAPTDPMLGTVQINGDGTLTFTPTTNITGPVAIPYQISDGHGGTANATLTVYVGANTPPASADVSRTLTEDGAYSFTAADFAFSDADAGQTLANVRIDQVPAQGALLLNGVPVSAGVVVTVADIGAGALTFVPAPDQVGAPYTTLTFSVQDSAGGFDAAPNTMTLVVTPVNDPPVTIADSGHGPEDTTLSGNVLANDSDIDGGALHVVDFTVQGVTYAAGATASVAGIGSLVMNADGSYQFAPAADFHGTVPVVSVAVSDGIDTRGSTLSLTIDSVADVVPDTVAASRNTPLTFNPITGAFETSGADSFADAGRTLTAVGAPAHGSTSFAANGDITYTPSTGYVGTDSFTYTVSAGGTTETSTIVVTVTSSNGPPVAVADSSTTRPENTATGNVILANDSDPDGDPLSVTQFVVNGVTHAAGSTVTLTNIGDFTLYADGTYVFDTYAEIGYNEGSIVPDLFVGYYAGPVPTVTYTISDGQANASAALNINVSVDTDLAPQIHPHAAQIAAGTSAHGELLDTFFSGGNVPQVTQYQVAGVNHAPGSTTVIAGVGSLTIAASGHFDFTPDPGYNGTVPMISWTASDGAHSSTSTLHVVVDPPASGGMLMLSDLLSTSPSGSAFDPPAAASGYSSGGALAGSDPLAWNTPLPATV